MELKQLCGNTFVCAFGLLIVPYGIETNLLRACFEGIFNF